MFSNTYFKYLVKSNFKIFTMFTFILCLLIAIVMAIFSPDMIQDINHSSANLSFNPLGDISSLIKFISNQYYGMFTLLLPMVYSIFVGNKLISGKIDNGEMAYHLSTPITRTQITFTSAIFLSLSLLIMFLSITLTGIIAAQMIQSGELDITIFLLLSLGAFILQLTISSFVFCASCIFNTSNKSLLFGAGIPIFFFVVNLLINMSSDLELLKVVSLFELFDKNAIIYGGNFEVQLFLLLMIGIFSYILGMIHFKNKDLPL